MRPLLLLAVLALSALAAEKKILVYTRNYTPDGKGYVHANVADSVAAIRKLGAEHGFLVDASEDPSVFTPANLKQYAALVFSNSNNEAFSNDAQREAFKHYIEAGGGYVGLHSATGSERNWDYYQHVAGGKFHRHPKMQTFTVTVADPSFPAMKGIPSTFEWTDECYYHINLNPGIKPLLTTGPKTLVDPKYAGDPGELINGLRPLAWYQTYDGGREFYLALGHKNEHYQNPILLRLILGGIDWAMGDTQNR